MHIRKWWIESRLSEPANWHETKRDEKEAIRRGCFIPRLKTGMDELPSSTPKNYASRYFQLKAGHGAIGAYLAKIEAISSRPVIRPVAEKSTNGVLIPWIPWKRSAQLPLNENIEIIDERNEVIHGWEDVQPPLATIGGSARDGTDARPRQIPSIIHGIALHPWISMIHEWRATWIRAFGQASR
ncbi:hypothetical protein MMC31_005350 [Peltigera leucophlebia]|nr:hypothetical protein [Peltigera leucophlebia]